MNGWAARVGDGCGARNVVFAVRGITAMLRSVGRKLDLDLEGAIEEQMGTSWLMEVLLGPVGGESFGRAMGCFFSTAIVYPCYLPLTSPPAASLMNFALALFHLQAVNRTSTKTLRSTILKRILFHSAEKLGWGSAILSRTLYISLCSSLQTYQSSIPAI